MCHEVSLRYKAQPQPRNNNWSSYARDETITHAYAKEVESQHSAGHLDNVVTYIEWMNAMADKGLESWPWDLTPNTQTATPTVMLSYKNLQKKNSYKYFSGVELGFPCCSGVGLLCWIVLSSASMACSSSEKGSWFSSWSRWLPAVDVGFIAKEGKWQIKIDELPKLRKTSSNHDSTAFCTAFSRVLKRVHSVPILGSMLRPLGFRIPQSGVDSIRVKVQCGMNFFSSPFCF